MVYPISNLYLKEDSFIRSQNPYVDEILYPISESSIEIRLLYPISNLYLGIDGLSDLKSLSRLKVYPISNLYLDRRWRSVRFAHLRQNALLVMFIDGLHIQEQQTSNLRSSNL